MRATGVFTVTPFWPWGSAVMRWRSGCTPTEWIAP